MKYLSVEEAIDIQGLRLVLTAGVPGPWGEAAKAILAFKHIEYTPVLQQGGRLLTADGRHAVCANGAQPEQ